MENQFQETRLRNLHIILVLSIIGSGFSFINPFITGLMLPTMKQLYYSGALPIPTEMTFYTEQVLETPRSFFFCNSLLYAMSLLGVVLMWHLRKGGFHLYTLAQLMVLLIAVLFLGREALSLGNVMFTILFVVYYYTSLRNLGVFSRTAKPNDTTESGSTNDPEEK